MTTWPTDQSTNHWAKLPRRRPRWDVLTGPPFRKYVPLSVRSTHRFSLKRIRYFLEDHFLL